MMLARSLLCAALLTTAACGSAPRVPAPAKIASRVHVPPEQRPKGIGLVVLVSVDQLRADLPLLLLSRFGAGGFRRLYSDGVSYDAAAYAHGVTETAVGHATLSTGALPRDHGIVGNEWHERGARVYSVDDLTNELVGAPGKGKSPKRLLVETVGDVLQRERPGALVRTVSLKERAAVLLAGHGGVAYWLNESTGSFVTSRYYARALPSWVSSFATAHPLDRLSTLRWELLRPESEYVAADDHGWEQRACGRAPCLFPHSFAERTGERLVHALKSSPFGDELTLAFVRALVESEPLGQDATPDLLGVSFSSTDYVGHAFGPESREAEDNLLRLDRTLEGLLQLLDQHVGRERYVLVLSADHGACEAPEFFSSKGEDAGRIDPVKLRAQIDKGLRARFKVGVELVSDFVNPTLVLHEQRIAALSLDLTEVERAAAELARAEPGVEIAFARTDLLAGSGPEHPLREHVERSVHPERSGHVYIVPKPHWLLATEPESLTAMHGTPWPYDTQVPLIVLGAPGPAQRSARPVDPRAIAPTLAALLRIPAPSGSTGELLTEALTPAAPPSAPPVESTSSGGAQPSLGAEPAAPLVR